MAVNVEGTCAESPVESSESSQFVLCCDNEIYLVVITMGYEVASAPDGSIEQRELIGMGGSQRHPAMRLFERPRAEHEFAGVYAQMRRYAKHTGPFRPHRDSAPDRCTASISILSFRNS